MPEYTTNLPNVRVTFGNTDTDTPKLVKMDNGKIIIASPQHTSDEPLHIDVFEYNLGKKEKAKPIDGQQHMSLAEFESAYNVSYHGLPNLDLLKAHKFREKELDIGENSVTVLGNGSQARTKAIRLNAGSKLVFSEGSSVILG